MPTTFLDLDFRKADKKFPGPPVAQIYVKSSFKDENNDRRFVSNRCVTFQEFEYQIKRLEDDLKTIRKKARKEFQSFKENR